ncbi:putative heat shock protein beta-11 [Monocercomonoides exilis]|uniref:putative heat shock protein beta-11 n=1 Tax=Monocercomonoides exilis TaxID=2049356 RepID=UPI00355A4F1A|nr:putative heat shock protein beta-11 [Monocercomonoides exilis]|eukprot:MONOS_595.1-p1 / transcript=MONOS_595.1 / gene=MONOS_595 / organism=Monocercomonoides_exilis_PA203 / gene_product=heat shock protein beta-11 / transcript_product=heat shock protein beta-11 / location=Mono_scaffold00009:219070-219618(+) / protein_length=132 / sequence_SO=supercontig / SO=protein_coding / is_pseudo=false
MSKDYALESEGGYISFSTSFHPEYPPDAMIDNDDRTFWVTTGCFPQEFVLSFPNPVDFEKIVINSSGIKKLKIELEVEDKSEHQLLTDVVFAEKRGAMQQETISLPGTAQSIRFVIESGYHEFVSIHKLSVM